MRSLGLDLLRAVAIVLVLASHTHLMEASWAHARIVRWIAIGGFVGVQLFFVLSGFLIGRILIRLAARPADRLRGWRVFMLRRWMRTLPLYWLVLAALALLWPPEFWLPDSHRLAGDLLAYGSMTQNLFWPMRDGWFSVSWSLAVEEWFYLTFSALLLGLARLVSPGRALALALALFVLSPPLLRLLVLGATPPGLLDDHLVPLWFDAIAIGVASTWTLARLRPGRLAAYCLLGVGLTLVLLVWNDGLGLWSRLGLPLRHVLEDDLLSLGLACCLPASLLLTRLPAPLALVVRRLSAWSYCLYLTHLSVLEIGGFYGPRWGLSPPQITAGCLLAVLTLAWLSWRLVEQPILRLRPAEQAPAELVAA